MKIRMIFNIITSLSGPCPLAIQWWRHVSPINAIAIVTGVAECRSIRGCDFRFVQPIYRKQSLGFIESPASPCLSLLLSRALYLVALFSPLSLSLFSPLLLTRSVLLNGCRLDAEDFRRFREVAGGVAMMMVL